MSWVIPSLRVHKGWISSIFIPCTFFFAFHRLVLTLSSFHIQPTVTEHEELIWLSKNLKLEVTKYSRQIYGPRGYAQVDDDDDDNDDLEVTQSFQLRKRHYWWWSCSLATHTHWHIYFQFLFFFLFFFSNIFCIFILFETLRCI